MRRRIAVAALAVAAGIFAACSDNPPSTSPTVNGGALKATISANGCVDPTLSLAAVNLEIQGLIANLFATENHRSSTTTMWDGIKKDKIDGQPLQNHIDNLTKWTLEKLSANLLSDPDGAGILNATTGSVRLLDLVFRCAGQTPTQVPPVPAGFDALFKLVAPSETGNTFVTSFSDAGAFIPSGALDESALLVLVRQPEDVIINTPFPKVSNTVDVALAGGKIKPGQNLSVLFCPLESISENRIPRLVVAHQFEAVGPSAPVGQGVEYLPPNQGGTLDCPHGVASLPQMEKNVFKRSVMQAAALAGKALSFLGPKSLYAGHAAIGGLISFSDDEGSLSPMVVVDPFVETGIFDVSIPTTTYGQAIEFSAQLRVTGVPAACGLATSPAVCTWVGQPVTQSLAGMPTLTLANLQITATLDGQSQADAIDASGNAQFSFTQINAGENQPAALNFPPTLNQPANAPSFGGSNAWAQYSVNRRPLAVIVNSFIREYGHTNPLLTYSPFSTQNGDVLTVSLATTATTASPVGEYPITGTVTGPRVHNYAVTLTPGTLTVIPAVPVLDQANDPALISITVGCGTPPSGSLFQSFKPSAARLTAVELRLVGRGSLPPGGSTTAVNIRSGTPGGPVLGTATATLTAFPAGLSTLVTFTFPTPLSVNANGTYVIEWIGSSDAIVTWVAGTGDTYANGLAYGCTGTSILPNDFNFNTYR